MGTNILHARGGSPVIAPHERGYHVVYRSGERNPCPGCGHDHWYIGRLTAECAFCATAIDLNASAGGGVGLFVSRGRRRAA